MITQFLRKSLSVSFLLTFILVASLIVEAQGRRSSGSSSSSSSGSSSRSSVARAVPAEAQAEVAVARAVVRAEPQGAVVQLAVIALADLLEIGAAIHPAVRVAAVLQIAVANPAAAVVEARAAAMTRIDREATIGALVNRRATAVLRDAIAIVRRVTLETTTAPTTRTALTSRAIGREIAMAIASE